jgi:hypothetical protein
MIARPLQSISSTSKRFVLRLNQSPYMKEVRRSNAALYPKVHCNGRRGESRTHGDKGTTERPQAGLENVFENELDAVMDEVPKGALALAGTAVLLLLMGWFFVYFAIFIPRGSVG